MKIISGLAALVAIVGSLVSIVVGIIQIYGSFKGKRKPASNMTERFQPTLEIDSRYFGFLYHFESESALCIRLIGAADEFFPPDTVHIIPDATPYEIPDDMLLVKDSIVKRLKEKSRQKGEVFFDGPHTRLIDYYITVDDESEKKHLQMKLGPISWYDYSVIKWSLDQSLKRRTISEIDSYIDLDEVAQSGIIRNNRLTNILCTATTLVTSDGFVLHSKRSSRVSTGQGLFTSCVAENIHQQLDHSLEENVQDDLPAPFRAVLRGIEEEISPKISEHVRSNPRSIFLLGLAFDLHSFQPDALFMVVLPLELTTVLEMCRQYPGKDFIEGQIEHVSIIDRKQLNLRLSNPNWIPGGKASLIRTIEFLDSVKNCNTQMEFRVLLQYLTEGKIPS